MAAASSTGAPLASASTGASSADGASSNDQWRVFLGLALLVGAYVFRVEAVRFTLRLARRALPPMFVWIKEFEKQMLRPLSWVVFLLLVWFGTYVMDLSRLASIDSDTITSVVTLLLGFPLIWVVINLCNYITWGIIRVQGWKRTASKDDDDYSRVMIVSEGVGVIKFLLVATVVSAFMVDEIGQITSFDSAQITTVAVIMVEIVFVFGAHSWMKNIMGGLMALQDEQVKNGLHLSFHGHEGVVERLYLQGFSLRQYDKGLAYIPNGALLENTVAVRTKELDRRCVVSVHVSHATKTAALRVFIQELDEILVRVFTRQHALKRGKASTVLGLDKQRRSHWDSVLHKMERSHLLAVGEEESGELQRRYWISVERAFVVHVTYYSQERHMKQLMAEKTEIVLEVTDLLAKLHIELYEPSGSVSAHSSSSETPRSHLLPASRLSRASRPASSPHIAAVATDESALDGRRDLRFGPATDPGHLQRLRRHPHDRPGENGGGGPTQRDFRRRRPHSTAAVTLL